MSDKLPTIEAAVVLTDDGIPGFTLRSQNMRTRHDFELLTAAMFNGLNLHAAQYAEQEGIPIEHVQLRLQRMIQELALGNATSPMTFEAQSNAPTTTEPQADEEDGTPPSGSSDRNVWGDQE